MSDSETQSLYSLDQVNQQIDEILSLEELDAPMLNKLVAERDQLIQSQLADLPEPQRQQFATQQLQQNQALQQRVSALFSETEQQLSKLMKSRKAIKRYKKS